MNPIGRQGPHHSQTKPHFAYRFIAPWRVLRDDPGMVTTLTRSSLSILLLLSCGCFQLNRKAPLADEWAPTQTERAIVQTTMQAILSGQQLIPREPQNRENQEQIDGMISQLRERLSAFRSSEGGYRLLISATGKEERTQSQARAYYQDGALVLDQQARRRKGKRLEAYPGVWPNGDLHVGMSVNDGSAIWAYAFRWRRETANPSSTVLQSLDVMHEPSPQSRPPRQRRALRSSQSIRARPRDGGWGLGL